MGIFNKKKLEVPENVATDALELIEPYSEIDQFMAAVSLDGAKHSIESEGSVRFYQNGAAVFSEGSDFAKNMTKQMLFGSLLTTKKLTEQMRFLYTDVSRAYFVKKGTIRLELNDGRYAFFIFRGLYKSSMDAVCSQLAVHGVNVEPFAGK